MTNLSPDSHSPSNFMPSDIYLPFFTYGVFKPGELAFLRIKDIVAHCQASSIDAELRIRDGLPIASPNSQRKLFGGLIHFCSGAEEEAYARISELEPQKQYIWRVTNTALGPANYLQGRSPEKGSVIPDKNVWNGREDPLFTVALEVVRETLEKNQRFDWDLKPLFRLEMAYLLLWTCIERYASLRYHLGDRATNKVMKIAGESAFIQALAKCGAEPREVCRADKPTERMILDVNSPDKALDYYYQIRSNLVHRGKGVPHDHDRLEKSLRELLAIFKMTLNAAFEESACAVSAEGF